MNCTSSRGTETPSTESKSTPLLPVGKSTQPKFCDGSAAHACRLAVTSITNVPVETAPVVTSAVVCASIPSAETPPVSVFHVSVACQFTSMRCRLIASPALLTSSVKLADPMLLPAAIWPGPLPKI